MAKNKSTKRKKVSKGSKAAKAADDGEILRLSEARCSFKEGGAKIEAICNLGDVSACVRQLRGAMVIPTEEESAVTE